MSSFEEKRQYKRFPLMKDIAKPVELFFELPTGPQAIPSILCDLSAGGMGLITFIPLEPGIRVIAQINLPGLKLKLTEGKIMWTLSKGDSHRVGISFTKIDKDDFEKINKMAEDYNDCEIKISAKIKINCSENCNYHSLCDKPHKKK
ncbi:MAG: PilZ domain-containing protein [Elusimicrobiota bacterium]